MVIAKRKELYRAQTRVVKINGDEIPVVQPSFEIATENWESFCRLLRQVYKNDKARSPALRILVNAVNLGIVDLKVLEKEIEKKADKVKEIIYI